MQSKSYHLGISYGTHDTSACVVHNGQIIAFSEEEKLRGVKRTSEFPVNSIIMCLRLAGINLEEINSISIPVNMQKYLENISVLYSLTDQKGFIEQTNFILHNSNNLRAEGVLAVLGNSKTKGETFYYYDHHLAHAASAFFTSGFGDAAILIVDGIGELDTISIFDASLQMPEIIRKVAGAVFPNSLGRYYGAISRYLGFLGPTKEGKVMAMAAFGKPVYEVQLAKMINWDNSMPQINTAFFNFGITPLQPSQVSNNFVDIFGPNRQPDDPLLDRHFNLAASLQAVLEKSIIRLGNLSKELTRRERLCYAGGVALNCSANSALRDSVIFEALHIPTAPHDAGLSIGCAYLSEAKEDGCVYTPHPQGIYLGADLAKDEIVNALKKLQLEYKLIDNPSEYAARLLVNGEIIGWFQGRAEMGPRALGNRSILADPRNGQNKEYINSAIKLREYFRPFAPSVLEEYSREIFPSSNPPEYMLYADTVSDRWASKIPAVLHADNTSRIHTVTKGENPRYYELINTFFKFTGIPLVLNTSLNGKEKPIVSSPLNALSFFIDSPLKHIFVGDYYFSKE